MRTCSSGRYSTGGRFKLSELQEIKNFVMELATNTLLDDSDLNEMIEIFELNCSLIEDDLKILNIIRKNLSSGIYTLIQSDSFGRIDLYLKDTSQPFLTHHKEDD